MLEKQKEFLTAAIAILLICGITLGAASTEKIEVNYSNQAKVEQYIRKAIINFRHGNEIKNNKVKVFKGITLRGKLGVVEYNYAKAAELAPYRLDLKFDVASTQILQGKVKKAIEIYKTIVKLAPENFNAKLLLGVYSIITGDTNVYQKQIDDLQRFYPEKFDSFLNIINNTEKNFSINLNVKPKKLDSKNNVIIILGYALAEDGSARPALVERLKQGLAAYKLNPKSKIIVTGGMPRSGMTESYVMQQWLINKGVNKKRIYMEDQSKDTVGNALFASKIIQKLKPEKIILVTSASHMRRAYSVLQTALFKDNLNIPVTNLVYLDYKSKIEAMKVTLHEKIIVFRDVLRCAGIWAYPGIQR
ncbi:MAG: YdcF family protein [Victivallales bacterium]|nr:YdcF family protein [Victivallales bacterium]